MEPVGKTTDTKTLHQYGDRELWSARGEEWSLPIYVDWYLDEVSGIHYGVVNPACALYPSQYLVMQSLLGIHDIGGSRERWTLPRKTIESILLKCPGVTPRYYYKWDDPHCFPVAPPQPVKITDSPVAPTDAIGSHAQSFLSYLSQARGIPTSMLRVVWAAISEEAPKWLVEHRGQLDLGFCQIAAIPLRINWKAIVAFKCKKWKLLSIFNSSETVERLGDLGLPGVLCSPQTVAITRHGEKRWRMDYNLEIVPTKAFRAAVVNGEGKRIIGGHRSYVAAFEATIETHYQFLINALRNYVKKAALPFARLHEGGKSGVIRFVPTSGNTDKVRGVALRHLPIDIVEAPSGFSVLAEGKPDSVRPQVAKVQALPDIPQGNDDMRECGGSGAAWVLMPNVSEGDVPGGPVLPESTPSPWKPSGLDEEGDI